MENIELKKYESLEEALTDLNAKFIKFETQEDIDWFNQNIFDRNNLIKDDEERKGMPQVKVKNNSILIYDLEDWNANYLVDYVQKLKAQNKYEFDVFYVNSPKFGKYITPNILFSTDDTKHFENYVEKVQTAPKMWAISPEHINNAIMFCAEGVLSTINFGQVEKLAWEVFYLAGLSWKERAAAAISRVFN